MESKAASYVKNRLQGMGSREAAREVGFATGVPGGHALKLYRAAVRAQNIEGDELSKRIGQVEDAMDRQRQKLRCLRRLTYAKRLVASLSEPSQ